MNWGNRLVLVFIVFITLIGILIYKSVTTKTELVASDYYNQELKYQDKINGINNANTIGSISIDQNSEYFTIYLPSEMNGETITGEAWFYCSTDAVKDRHIKLDIADGAQVINKKDLAKGRMQLKLAWKVGDKDYYTEQNVSIN